MFGRKKRLINSLDRALHHRIAMDKIIHPAFLDLQEENRHLRKELKEAETVALDMADWVEQLKPKNKELQAELDKAKRDNERLRLQNSGLRRKNNLIFSSLYGKVQPIGDSIRSERPNEDSVSRETVCELCPIQTPHVHNEDWTITPILFNTLKNMQAFPDPAGRPEAFTKPLVAVGVQFEHAGCTMTVMRKTSDGCWETNCPDHGNMHFTTGAIAEKLSNN